MNVLEIRNVTKRFGNLVAVSDVSLNVAKGELRAIIGPNGAGKTTFFNLISGFFPPTSGAITFDGRDITRLATHERVTLRHGPDVPDHRDLSGTHRVRKRPHRRGSGRRLSAAALDQPRGKGSKSIGRSRTPSNWYRWKPRRTGWSANSRMATSAPPRSRWRWR